MTISVMCITKNGLISLTILFVEGIPYCFLEGGLILKKKALRKIFYERWFTLVGENIH